MSGPSPTLQIAIHCGDSPLIEFIKTSRNQTNNDMFEHGWGSLPEI